MKMTNQKNTLTGYTSAAMVENAAHCSLTATRQLYSRSILSKLINCISPLITLDKNELKYSCLVAVKKHMIVSVKQPGRIRSSFEREYNMSDESSQ